MKKFILISILFVFLSFGPYWRALVSPLSEAPTFQYYSGIGEWLAIWGPSTFTSGYSSLWGLGSSVALGISGWPLVLPLYLLMVAFGNVNLAFRIYLILMFSITHILTFYFMKRLLGTSYFATFLGTLVTVYSPLNINSFAQGGFAALLVVPAFYGTLYFARNFISNRKAVSLLGFFVASLTIGTLPPAFLLNYISIGIYLVFCISGRNLLRDIARKALDGVILLCIGIISSLYWIVPALIALIQTPTQSSFQYALSSGALNTLISQKIGYFPPNNFIGMDYGFVLYRNIHGYVSPTLKSFIAAYAYDVIPIVITIAMVSVLLNWKHKKSLSLYFCFLYLLGVSLYAGANFPGLLLFLMQHFYYPFLVLRSSALATYMIFAAVGAMVCLTVDTSLTEVTLKRKSFIRVFTSLAVIFILIVSIAFALIPLIKSGDFMDTSAPVELPSYYQQLSNFLLPQLSSSFFRVIIPGVTGIYRTYWAPNNFWETSIFQNLNIPFVSEFNTQPPPSVAQAVFKQLELSDATAITPSEQRATLTLLGLMSVKYVAIQCDIIGLCDGPAFTDKSMQAKLGTSAHMMRFGNVTLYSNPDFIPILYIPSDLVLVNDTPMSVMANVFSQTSGVKFGKLAITSDTNLFGQFAGESNVSVGSVAKLPTATILNYTANVLYSSFAGSVSTSGKPFLLVLNSNYDPNFQVSVKGGSVISHLVINSYANGWIINPTESILDFKIVYSGDTTNVLMLVPSLLFVVCMLIYGVFSRFRVQSLLDA